MLERLYGVGLERIPSAGDGECEDCARESGTPHVRIRHGVPTLRPKPAKGRTEGGLSGLTLRDAARMLDQAVRDKTYRQTSLGHEVARFLRHMQMADRSPRTLDEYESLLSRFAVEHAHLEVSAFEGAAGADYILDFLHRHYAELASGTRRKNRAILSSFFKWMVTGQARREPGRPARCPAAEGQPPHVSQPGRNPAADRETRAPGSGGDHADVPLWA
jgi:hypothetical protein